MSSVMAENAFGNKVKITFCKRKKSSIPIYLFLIFFFVFALVFIVPAIIIIFKGEETYIVLRKLKKMVTPTPKHKPLSERTKEEKKVISLLGMALLGKAATGKKRLSSFRQSGAFPNLKLNLGGKKKNLFDADYLAAIKKEKDRMSNENKKFTSMNLKV